MTSKAALVWCPFPDKDTAKQVATQLLEMKLIACANILGPADAVFEWGGKVNTATEFPVVFKTTASVLDALIEQLGEIHPYDVPAIMGWHCDAGHPETLNWLQDLKLGAAR